MADIEIKICTACGSIIPGTTVTDTVWYCPSCGFTQSGDPQNADSSEETV